MRADRTIAVLVLSLAAGGLDTTTGLLLVAAPETTLGLFGAAPPVAGGGVLLRFIGAFVVGVGLSYLWGLATRRPDRRLRRLHGVWGATAAIRSCVAVFVVAAVATGGLGASWLVIGATDAALAATQILGLRTGWLET